MSNRSFNMAFFLVLFVFVTIVSRFDAGIAFAQSPSPGMPLTVFGKFKAPLSDKDGKPRGISGMSCLGKVADIGRECIVVNDEERFAEIAILTQAGLIPTGRMVQFVEKGESREGILGSPRDPECKKKNGTIGVGKFSELDGEGAAISDGYVYVVGSHSCSGKGKYKPSSYLVARFKAHDSNHIVGNGLPVVERSWRIADMLLASDVRMAYGRKKETGTNIEGIAISGGRLYVGLRSPNIDGDAFIVSAPVKDLFAAGSQGLKNELVSTINVRLGANTGIRDLAALKDGRLLILSGPTVSQLDIGFKIWLLGKPAMGAQLRLLTELTTQTVTENGEIAKAETIVVIDEKDTSFSVLVLYDNIDEGRPILHSIVFRSQ